MTSRASSLSLAILVLSLSAAGCARKAAEAPPQVAAAPPAQAPAPEPAAPEPPAPEPAAPDSVVPDSAPQPMAEFQPAFFEFDSYRLDDGARAALDTDARILRTQPDRSIVVEGHCDERGTIEYNEALGERRAEAARDYLVASGVDRSRIEIVSYGKDRPFADGHDEEAWSQNRRAHVVVR